MPNAHAIVPVRYQRHGTPPSSCVASANGTVERGEITQRDDDLRPLGDIVDRFRLKRMEQPDRSDEQCDAVGVRRPGLSDGSVTEGSPQNTQQQKSAHQVKQDVDDVIAHRLVGVTRIGALVDAGEGIDPVVERHRIVHDGAARHRRIGRRVQRAGDRPEIGDRRVSPDGHMIVEDERTAQRRREGHCRQAEHKQGRGQEPARPGTAHSHSIVAGGLLLTSYTTRFTPGTSLAIRFEISASTSGGNGNQSAVIPSRDVTARSPIVWS